MKAIAAAVGIVVLMAGLGVHSASGWGKNASTTGPAISPGIVPAIARVVAPVIAPGEIGSHFPGFAVKGLRGRAISSSEFRGKVVLVDFWATWCEPCKKEMPGYQRLADTYGPRGFAVLGFKFNTMMDTEDPLVFAKQIGVRYPLAVATEQIRQKFGGIKGLPTTMVYDREGVLRQKVIGFDYTATFEAEVKRLLGNADRTARPTAR